MRLEETLLKKLKKAKAPFYAALVVVDPTTGRMLLGKRKEDGMWTGPAGGANPGESPSQTAIREAFEEANLILKEKDLIELPSSPTEDGKFCHCFLTFVLPETQAISSKNDPDEEVERWDWYLDVPGETTKNRLTTINHAKLKMAGLTKSQGEGSKGGVVIGHTKSGKPIYSHKSHFEYKDFGSKDHQDAMNAHYTAWEKAKDPELRRHHKFKVMHHMNAAERVKAIEEKRINRFKKGHMLLDDSEGMTQVNTAEQAELTEASEKDGLLTRLMDLMDGYEPGENPRGLLLDGGSSLSLVKVDNGIYSGYVKNSDATETLCSLDKQTLPEIVEILKLKEIIKPRDYAEAMDLVASQIEQQEVQSAAEAELMRQLPEPETKDQEQSLMNLVSALRGYSGEIHFHIHKSLLAKLEKAKKPFPVGTIRVWAGQKYVKHADGWVAVGGQHHGKLMGKFKQDATHKDHADDHKDKPEGMPEIKEMGVKEEAPKKQPKDDPKKKPPKRGDNEGEAARIAELEAEGMTTSDAQGVLEAEQMDAYGPMESPKESPKEKPKKGGRKGMPIGTIREYGGQKYVKTADGWVAVGGKHHGKLMGEFKFEADADNKKIADKHLDKPSTESTLSDKLGKEAAKKDNPRKKAKEEQEKLDAEQYEFARDSEFGNMGEDLKGSARHKRNRWRGLEEAEKDGTAEAMVKRDMLLKNEPVDFVSPISSENYKGPLAAFMALKKFPATPKSKALEFYATSSDDTIVRVKIKQGERTRVVFPSLADSYISNGWEKVEEFTKHNLAKKVRSDYVKAFNRIKAKAESLKNESDEMAVVKEMRKEVNDLIDDLRKEDPYSDLANNLISYHNNTLSQYGRKSSSVVGEMRLFSTRLADRVNSDHSGESTEVRLDKMKEVGAEAAKQIVEGVSIDKAFGVSKDNKRFNPADAYVNHAERIGPEKKGLGTREAQEKALLNDMGMRGVQWGNSVTDDERKHHLKHVSTAFDDLAEVLGLPKEMCSFNGRLGIAIGARGKGRALAHYEPSQRVINLTRKGGVGSLAHEWGHGFDNVLNEVHGQGKTDFLTNYAEVWGARHVGEGMPVVKAMAELVDSPTWKEFRSRMRSHDNWRKMSEGQRQYWSSTIEMFARTFECHIKHKLEEKGRKNTYLSGVSDDSYLWPTKEESKKLAPLFDKLFSTFKNSEYLKKALELFGLTEE